MVVDLDVDCATQRHGDGACNGHVAGRRRRRAQRGRRRRRRQRRPHRRRSRRRSLVAGWATANSSCTSSTSRSPTATCATPTPCGRSASGSSTSTPASYPTARQFALRVNGERIWVRGVNWIPADCFPARNAGALVTGLLDEAVGGERQPRACVGRGRVRERRLLRRLRPPRPARLAGLRRSPARPIPRRCSTTRWPPRPPTTSPA